MGIALTRRLAIVKDWFHELRIPKRGKYYNNGGPLAYCMLSIHGKIVTHIDNNASKTLF